MDYLNLKKSGMLVKLTFYMMPHLLYQTYHNQLLILKLARTMAEIAGTDNYGSCNGKLLTGKEKATSFIGWLENR